MEHHALLHLLLLFLASIMEPGLHTLVPPSLPSLVANLIKCRAYRVAVEYKSICKSVPAPITLLPSGQTAEKVLRKEPKASCKVLVALLFSVW